MPPIEGSEAAVPGPGCPVGRSFSRTPELSRYPFSVGKDVEGVDMTLPSHLVRR